MPTRAYVFLFKQVELQERPHEDEKRLRASMQSHFANAMLLKDNFVLNWDTTKALSTE